MNYSTINNRPQIWGSRSLLYSLLWSFLAQLGAVGAAIAISEFNLGAAAIAIAYCCGAYVLARLADLSLPWQLANVLLGPALALQETSGYSSAPLIFIALSVLLLFGPAAFSQVPYYPTNPALYDEIAKLLPQKEKFTFVDLGSGFGGLLRHLGKKLPEGHFYGLELSPLAFIWSFIAAVPQKNVAIKYKNFWKEDLKNYDVVYCFLAPPVMERVWQKGEQEMKVSSLFISLEFPAPAAAARKEINLIKSEGRKIFVYRL